MNFLMSFNMAMDYLETVLDTEIDEAEIFKITGYSYPMFSRIFSIFTDFTLHEYIRLRRLTKAAMEISESNIKIIDIALKYGYDSPNSFTSAFKKFHNTSPVNVRKGAAIKVFSKLRLSLSIQGGEKMNARIEVKKGFMVAGVKKENINSKLCPEVWEELFSKADYNELSSLGNKMSYGVCYDVQDVNEINYMAGFDVEDIERAKKIGLEIMEIPEAKYACIELVGKVPECIHMGWKFAMETFLPENRYKHSGSPDFEVYFEGDMYSDDYVMELWIPIIKED